MGPLAVPPPATVQQPAKVPRVGSLMANGASFPDLLRRTAAYMDKILKAARPANLPVEQPMKFEPVTNLLKTARALGLPIPPCLRIRADHLIQ